MKNYEKDGGEYLDFARSPDGQLTRELLTPILLEITRPQGKRILDLGCGDGYYTRLLKAHGAKQVIGVDISPDLLAEARQADPQGGYKRLDFTRESFKPAELFDVALANMVLMNLPDLNQAYEKIITLLARGGHLIEVIANPYYVTPVGSWKRHWLKLHLQISNYFSPPQQHFSFSGSTSKFAHYHHQVSKYINVATSRGFTLKRFLEPQISEALSKKYPTSFLSKQLRQVPIFLILEFQHG